jgi:hypothetical protein
MGTSNLRLVYKELYDQSEIGGTPRFGLKILTSKVLFGIYLLYQKIIQMDDLYIRIGNFHFLKENFYIFQSNYQQHYEKKRFPSKS